MLYGCADLAGNASGVNVGAAALLLADEASAAAAMRCARCALAQAPWVSVP